MHAGVIIIVSVVFHVDVIIAADAVVVTLVVAVAVLIAAAAAIVYALIVLPNFVPTRCLNYLPTGFSNEQMQGQLLFCRKKKNA